MRLALAVLLIPSAALAAPPSAPSAPSDRHVEVFAQLGWAGWAISPSDDLWDPAARVGFGHRGRTSGIYAALEASRLSPATAGLVGMLQPRRGLGGHAGLLFDTGEQRLGAVAAACWSFDDPSRPCLELELRDRSAGPTLVVRFTTSIDVLRLIDAIR